MVEYTTPDFVFRVKSDDIDLTTSDHIYVTLKQGCTIVTKTDQDIDVYPKEIHIWMDQDEISQFKSEGEVVEVQLNWTYLDGQTYRTKRAATTIKNFKVSRNLLKKVVE